MKQIRDKKSKKVIVMGMMAAMIVIAALFLFWWKGAFLPGNLNWVQKEFPYFEGSVLLKNRELHLSDQNGKVLFQSSWDWCVQDVLSYDIDHDEKEELILLVWKHGSYGDHLPIWETHNDIRLEQHIFIYRWDEKRDSRLRPVWMSSALGYEVSSIHQGAKDTLVVTDAHNESRAWIWEQFGLKLVGSTKKETVSFLAAGDNLIHIRLLKYGKGRENEKDGYDYFYENVKDQIQGVDLASINQETIFVEDPGLISDFPRFGTPVEVGEAIVNAGFDIVTLANNHALDKGAYGIDVTTDFYRKQDGVICVGVHSSEEAAITPEESVAIIEKKGIRIALLNATYGTNGLPSPKENPYMVERFRDEERLIEQLRYARSHADVVIMFAHWGTEYAKEPDEYQKSICKLLLKEKVDVVIGTHPHVLQPYEILTGEEGHRMLVYYSLGNLISGQTRADCTIGGLARFNIVRAADGVVSVEDARLEEVENPFH